jgi:EAL domain-containing protein (putative c-di-GMP-specific phosphodiesterase class I)
MGVKMSIDDFGTGYSSLSRLKEMPVSEIKIDRSFVMDMMESSNDEAIVQATVSLAHNLGLEVVAEGVETQEAAKRLKELGCDHLQGFLFSKPVSPDDLVGLVGKTGTYL